VWPLHRYIRVRWNLDRLVNQPCSTVERSTVNGQVVEEPNANSASGEPKAHTPAYASFDSSTDKLPHLLAFISHGSKAYLDEFETKVAPEAMRIAREIAQVGKPQDEGASDQVARNNAEMRDTLLQRLSDTLLKPSNEFTGGLLTVREWIPVLLVNTVESYLEDVLIYAAKVDPTIMESTRPRPTVPYAEVLSAQSLEELKDRLKEIFSRRWAKNFVNDGGPDTWIKKLTKMGAWLSARNRERDGNSLGSSASHYSCQRHRDSRFRRSTPPKLD
jgi:hypothetical protein